MTTRPGRTATALLVVDAQIGVLAGAIRRETVVATLTSLVERARDEGVTVIWIQHADEQLGQGTSGWHLVPELRPTADEPVVHKHYGDAFEDTTLESELAARGVGRVIVTGAQTDACIRATLHGAFVRGYDTVLVADAHTTEDLSAYGAAPPEQVIAHTNIYWTWQAGPGRTASVVTADEVAFVEPA